ncbi:transposase [Tahibacter sp. UC22_41]|uniref:transposase n=1 Tax=Tahibacter sp. UC22_41 TaxID=3350178 RepID=UPI0036DCFEA8
MGKILAAASADSASHARIMATPRSRLVPPDAEGCYHCIQRCVRRAFLCGVDRYTGRSFEHRKPWIEDRLRHLSECFAIAIHAYAIMENHLHIVVQMIPVATSAWSDEEVATRWVRLFPPAGGDSTAIDLKRQQLRADPARLAVFRTRLGNLSWLMRCLAEPIARRANREDLCKGRFWEGRYKCQVLCDERALLAAMAYVDLNPIRAGVAEQLDTSLHTSARARIRNARASPGTLTTSLRPVLGMQPNSLPLSTTEYLRLLDWTGRALAPGKPGRINEQAPPILETIDNSPARWTLRVRSYGGGWARAAGSAQDLMILAERIGQRWLKGIRLALRLS